MQRHEVHLTPARPEHLSGITDIYNDAILKTTATFDTTPKSIDEQKLWYEKHGDEHPIIVALKENEVVGWASLSQWSDRCAYSETAEVSVYIKESCRGQNIGSILLGSLVAKAKENGLHTLVSRIADANDSSVRLHTKHGFHKIGVMKEVGKKFGKLLDVHLYQIVF